MKCFLLFAFSLFTVFYGEGQVAESALKAYTNCLDSLKALVEKDGSFKKAVFLTENCFLGNEMRYEKFDEHIDELATIARAWQSANPIRGYRYADSDNIRSNFSIFKLLKDTIRMVGQDQKVYKLPPYTYDFNDFFGQKDWSNMFVTKLLASHKGNCHSLPYLYKILADELGASCWITLAPNHAYISNRCKKPAGIIRS